MLRAFQDKIKRIWSGALRALGGAPQHYWGYLLVLWLILLIAIFVLDAAVFVRMRDGAFGEVYLPQNIGVKSVDRATLGAAAEIIAGRAKRFEAALIAPIPRDPGQ